MFGLQQTFTAYHGHDGQNLEVVYVAPIKGEEDKLFENKPIIVKKKY